MRQLFLLAFVFSNTLYAFSQANTTLSNLTAPTAINQSLVPNSNNTRNLGSSSLNWRSFYLKGSIWKGSQRFLSNTGIGNTFLGLQTGKNNSGRYNTALGDSALLTNTTGSYNTAAGSWAMRSNTTGSYNTATGAYALWNNTTGNNNTATGNGALNNTTTGSSNTAIGTGALYDNTTGYNNTANGDHALSSNTTGGGNTGEGAFALQFNTTGSDNTATGVYALYLNTTGFSNTAMGNLALFANTTGYHNTAIGKNALVSNSTGVFNVASGDDALFSNTTGDNNLAYGSTALYSNTTGGQNLAVGNGALYYNTIGSDNIAIGTLALRNNTTGNSNTATGWHSLLNNTTAAGNTATGNNALYANTTGSENTATGDAALIKNTTGLYNTAFGVVALVDNITGNYNTAIGYAAGTLGHTDLTNATAIGYNANSSASNTVIIGSASVVNIGGIVNWSVVSDGRFKKNLQANVHGLDFINQLKPVTYNMDVKAFNTLTGLDEVKSNRRRSEKVEGVDNTDSYEKEDALEVEAIKNKEKIVYSGFVAQQVEAVAKQVGYEFSGIHRPQNAKDYYSLSYADFVVPLVKAVQQLDSENKELNNEVAELRQMILDVKNGTNVLTSNAAFLEQNTPNPVSSSTTIRYYIPTNITSAVLNITNVKGQLIRSTQLTSGSSQVNLNTSMLASGTYNYSLVVDGKQVDSKRLIVAR